MRPPSALRLRAGLEGREAQVHGDAFHADAAEGDVSHFNFPEEPPAPGHDELLWPKGASAYPG
eukprot:10439338-Alexandrium_andersonii.AAC.1